MSKRSRKKGKKNRPAPQSTPEPAVSSIEVLRDRIVAAAREIERLRKDNEQLADGLKVLWARASEQQIKNGTVISFDEKPDQLREKIEHFIAAIDRYLENEEPVD